MGSQRGSRRQGQRLHHLLGGWAVRLPFLRLGELFIDDLGGDLVTVALPAYLLPLDFFALVTHLALATAFQLIQIVPSRPLLPFDHTLHRLLGRRSVVIKLESARVNTMPPAARLEPRQEEQEQHEGRI